MFAIGFVFRRVNRTAGRSRKAENTGATEGREEGIFTSVDTEDHRSHDKTD